MSRENALPAPGRRPQRRARLWTGLADTSWIATLLLLGMLLPTLLPADIGPGAAVGRAVGAAEEAAEDDDDAYFADDGSGALAGPVAPYTAPELVPVSPAEEEALLGDWGDSASEAED